MENKKQFIVFVIVIAILVAIGVSCSSGSSSGGRKWSDLSDVEKENARWAYHAQQAINDR